MENENYRNKVQEILKKISNGEQVIEAPKKDEIGELIKTKGVQDGIRSIFGTLKENHEQEIEKINFNNNINDKKVSEFKPDDFIQINNKNEAPDTFPLWQKAQQFFRRIGKVSESGDAYTVITLNGNGGDPSKILFRLVKNKQKESVPYMMISFDEENDPTPAELAIDLLNKLGMKINENSIVETPTHIYVEFDI